MPLGGVVVDIDEVPQSTQVIPSADSLRSTLCISGRNHGRKMRQALHVGKNITSTSTSFWDWIKYVLTVYNCNILYQMETHLRLWTFISCNIPVSFKYIYPFFFPIILKSSNQIFPSHSFHSSAMSWGPALTKRWPSIRFTKSTVSSRLGRGSGVSNAVIYIMARERGKMSIIWEWWHAWCAIKYKYI